MNLEQIMKYQVFAVLGDTINPEKYACKIKNKLLENGYTAYGVGKEFNSLDEIPEEIDVVDLCINPVKGLALLKEAQKAFFAVVIQPGAESPEIIEYLTQQKIPFIEGCLLVGMSLYKK